MGSIVHEKSTKIRTVFLMENETQIRNSSDKVFRSFYECPCALIYLLLFLVYSGYYGLPLILIQSKLDSFQSEYGMRVEVDRKIRPEGWIIRNVTFHSTNPYQLGPLFSFNSIHVGSLILFRLGKEVSRSP